MKKFIPNSITLLNLFLGCIAVVMALKGLVYLAGILIGICAILDFLDGFLARILKAGSALGQQLDSLADLISFGMAPAAITFFYLEQAVQLNNTAASLMFLPFIAFFIAVFSGLRLAIFNIDTRQSSSFIGLPTPANALFFASIPVVLTLSQAHGPVYQALTFIINNIWVLTAIVILSSALLVSPLRMFSLKFKSLKWKDNSTRFVFIIGAILLFLFFQIRSIPLVVIFYIILSTIEHFFSSAE